MNNKLYGVITLIGAPFLFIGYVVETNNTSLLDSWFTGMWGFIYITGWTFAMIYLKHLRITGESLFGRSLMWVILVTLCIANISNLYQWIVPRDKPFFFFYIDLCWPLSNLLMLFVGVMVIAAKRLQGWRRYVPLFVGCWLPVSIGALVLMGKNDTSMMIGAVYSLIAWILLAVLILKTPRQELAAYSAPKVTQTLA